nr:hypothetical protein [Kibdelosporangium sp. MJ126-NF4]
MTLPPVAAPVVAEVLDHLPTRLRKRLDAALDKAKSWTVDDSGTVVVDEDTRLTFTLTDGVLATATDLVCSCLLAPKCLHRAIAVSVAPVGSGTVLEAPPAGDAPPEMELTQSQSVAADLLWHAGSTIVRAGVSGSGAVARAELLRAVHVARLAGLHRASAAGLTVAASLLAAQTGDPAYRREELTGQVHDLLVVCHGLRTGTGDLAALVGVARRAYRPTGSLRLYGLCTEAVLTGSGYAGVVTHLVDALGHLWTIPAVMPGGADQVRTAAEGPVAVGESGLSHRELSRAGLLLPSASVSDDGRIGAGTSARAVAASGVAWTEEPIARLWAEPVADQARRAFDSDGLVFLTTEVVGGTGSALRVTADARPLDLVAGSGVGWENLRLLAGRPGLRLLVIARPLTDRPGTAVALAVRGDDLRLPDSWDGQVNVDLDRLQRAHVGDAEPVPMVAAGVSSPVEPLDRWLGRVVGGGRSMPVTSSPSPDRARLASAGLVTGANLLGMLEATARDQERDLFGRLVADTGEEFTRAWLSAAVYSRAFTRSSALRAWITEQEDAGPTDRSS